MAELQIGKKKYEAKTDFRFEKHADKKYRKEDNKNEYSGLEQIYQDLLSFKSSALIAFWDCATSHLRKDQPSLDSIEEALIAIIEEEGTDRLFKEAFKEIDESNFFKKQLKEFWKNLDLAEEMAEDDKEKRQIQTAKKMFNAKRSELLA